MRRVLVIFLIFLFPLHVFAQLIDSPVSLHIDTVKRVSPSATTSSNVDSNVLFDVAANYDHDSAELPASADIHDSFVQDAWGKSADCLTYSKPAYIPLPEYLLFLPLLKPPPLV